MLTQYENIAVRLKFPSAKRKQPKHADAAEERKKRDGVEVCQQ